MFSDMRALLVFGLAWTDSFTVRLFVRPHGSRPAGRSSLKNLIFLSKCVYPSSNEVLRYRLREVISLRCAFLVGSIGTSLLF